MQYRTMPGQKEKLSILGLGLMRLPTTPDNKLDEDKCQEMLHYALDNGVNYFDTAWPYHGGESEPLLGRFVDQVPREKLYIATKLPCWLVKTPSDLDSYLDQQLEKLRTDHIDYYLLHSLGQRSWKQMRGLKVLDWLDKARSDGKIRHIGFSFHDKYPVFRKIVEAYDWEFCQFMFNYLDTRYQAGIRGYELSVQKGLGIIAMEPLRGGKLVQHVPQSIAAIWSKSRHAWSPVERALNWVWNFPGSTVALSGMSSLEQLKENIRLAKHAKAGMLDDRELKVYNQARLEYLRRIAIPCSECRYCLPCPHKVAIPGVFGIYNEAIMFEAKERHTHEYKAWITEEMRADKCVQCGECLSKCPQHIDIPTRMQEVAKFFAED
ncbi:MAG: aldo/keto reductase [Candidatus Syntrophosphaera sp.]|nr:aldo/keto reductase [Candidatus Syntrophosphaera sp.]